MALFDRLTIQDECNSNSRSQDEDIINKLFPPFEVWEEAIEGEQLLDEIKQTIAQYVIADEETIIAATLWVTVTWFIDKVNYAPIANITAPEKRCGKTKLLSVLNRLSYRAFTTANISAAALFRLIELYKPTLLIDEVDSFLNLHEDMRGIINAGFSRESAFIVRCVGDEQLPTPFNVWGAKALCGIGKLADTLQDRSIPLKLRRKSLGESVQNVDRSDPEQWAILRAKLARFAQDNGEQLQEIEPLPIDGLNDRANDCFEPLLQIAILAGGHWFKTAKATALMLYSEQDNNDSMRTELLRDIKTLFDGKRIDRILSHDLVNELNSDNEANWCVWNKGRGITARNLAKILKEFDIVSKSIRINFDNAKGYSRDQFLDAFNRYLTDYSIQSTQPIELTQPIIMSNTTTAVSKGRTINDLLVDDKANLADHDTPQDNTTDINLMEFTPQQTRWLYQLANYLQVTPDYLLERQLLIKEDVIEYSSKDPAIVADCLRPNIQWR